MALGNNLRKKKLLPDKDPAEEKKANPKAKASGTASKKKAQAKKKAAPKKKNSSTTENESLKELEIISQEQYEHRKLLQQRYDQDLDRMKGKKVQLIVFSFKGQRFAVEIDKSREVVKTPSISSLPHVARYVRGVVNVRGFVIVTLDLAHKFFGVQATDDSVQYLLVVEHHPNKLGLLMPDVPDTVTINGDTMESSADILTDLARNDTYIKALIKHETGTIFLLDVEELIENNKVCILPATPANVE